jgi:hypothetical protein
VNEQRGGGGYLEAVDQHPISRVAGSRRRILARQDGAGRRNESSGGAATDQPATIELAGVLTRARGPVIQVRQVG